MILIGSAEEMARALDSPLQPELKQLLECHWQRLCEYDDYALSELAIFVIVQPNDTLAEMEAACSRRLVEVGGGEAAFAIPIELISEHRGWVEVTFILEDSGFGLVLLIPKADGIDPLLSAACHYALDDVDSHAAD